MIVVDCVERCSHPQAEDGHQISEGCLLRTCKAGVWRTSLAGNLCCYERTAYTINTTISSSMSKDGCVKVDIDCVEEIPGQAKMILSMKNYCEEFATQEQIEEIKELLERQRETEVGCKGGDEEGEEKEGPPSAQYKDYDYNASYNEIPEEDTSEKNATTTPKFISTAQSVLVNEGDTVRLPCIVDRLEGFMMLWRKNNDIITVGSEIIEKRVRLEEEKNGNHLIIGKASLEDGGAYTCEIYAHVLSIYLAEITHHLIIRGDPVSFPLPPPLPGYKLFYEAGMGYGIPLAEGTTLTEGVVADTCEAVGMRAVCSGGSSCEYYSAWCHVVDANGDWCARDNSYTSGNPTVYYAYCVPRIE